jgi:carboxyl-terminal processing protease
MVRSSDFLSTIFASLRYFSSYTFILPVIILAACAGTPARPIAANPTERDLFVEASEDILEFHLKAAHPDEIAVNGLKQLSQVDPAVSVERTADRVILHYADEARDFGAPPAGDVHAWGKLSAEVLATARDLSPVVAAVAPDRLDEIVIDGSLAALDPYSRYARPEVARQRRAARDGFAGIGVTLDIHESDVRIASVMPDTPAATAGLIAGDRIVTLDGVPVAKLGPEDIRRHLRGPAQTLVQLAVARKGIAQPIEIMVKRANIVPESVTLKEESGIAWLKLRSFNQQTGPSLAALLQKAHSDLGKDMKGIVLDLRDNPGGLLDQSVDVASLFLESGDIVSTTGRNPQSIQHFVAGEKPGAETLPMVVLVNGGSASASEIVASALQDAGRAIVIGTSSYGKGTVQQVLRTANDGELTVTWAQLITRQGYRLNTHGVVPTLCTAGFEDGAAGMAALFAAKPSLVNAAFAQSRRALDDAGWHDLRALCPPTREKRAIDGLVADKILTDPPLYRRVLASMASAQVAATR